MRLTATAATRWPAPELLAGWWRREVGTALDELVSGGGARGLRRTAGSGAAPGSRWQATHPGERGATAEVEVTGTPADRGLRASGHLASDPRLEAVLEVDGLDVPRRVVSRSSLRYLSWDAVVTTEAASLLDVRLRLDWLLLDVSAAVRSRGAAEQLEVRVGVRGRGAWRPVLAPLLRSLRGPLERELAVVTDVAARALRDAAAASAPVVVHVDDRPGPPADAAAAVTSSQVSGSGGGPPAGVRRVDLSWLATPVRAVRHLGATSGGGDRDGLRRRPWRRAGRAQRRT